MFLKDPFKDIFIQINKILLNYKKSDGQFSCSRTYMRKQKSVEHHTVVNFPQLLVAKELSAKQSHRD